MNGAFMEAIILLFTSGCLRRRPHERGWISLATYSNVKNWQDLFGVNLGAEDGQTVLVLFHVPKFGQGRFERRTHIPFPMKKWVRIEVIGRCTRNDPRLPGWGAGDAGRQGLGADGTFHL